MNNFISVHDVTDIDSLVRSALAYKADPSGIKVWALTKE